MNVVVQKNDNQKYEACFKNDQGEFLITLGANGRIYIGFFTAENENITDVDFVINKSDEIIYEMINKFYILSNLAVEASDECKVKVIDKNDIVLLSEDFDESIASKLKISKVEDGYKLTFTKSKSENEMNSFFVSIKRENSKYYPVNNCVRELYTDAISIDMERRQVRFEDIVPCKTNKIRRLHKTANK